MNESSDHRDDMAREEPSEDTSGEMGPGIAAPGTPGAAARAARGTGDSERVRDRPPDASGSGSADNTTANSRGPWGGTRTGIGQPDQDTGDDQIPEDPL